MEEHVCVSGVLATVAEGPHALLQEPCAVDPAPGYTAGAHQFGLSQNSHLVLPLNQSDVRRR